MLNVRLAGGYLYEKQLFTLMASFCAVLFPRGVLGEIWHLIKSVSEGFLTYSFCEILAMQLDTSLL